MTREYQGAVPWTIRKSITPCNPGLFEYKDGVAQALYWSIVFIFCGQPAGIFLAHPGKLGVCLVAVCKENAYITWTEFVGKLRWESNANTEYGVLELGNGTMWQ
jgi:hypothetical protein